jgi:hypothetical protein
MIPVRAWTLASFVMLTAGLGAAQDAQPPILFDRPFGEIDVNEDGVIDIVEFNSAVDARFVALDVATRGRLEPVEMPAAERALLRTGDRSIDPGRYQTVYDEQFHARDANHDGRLPPAEWR